MRTEVHWRWRVPDDRWPGRTYVTRWAMNEAEALARWPTAVREPGTMVPRHLPETEEEIMRQTTGGRSTWRPGDP